MLTLRPIGILILLAIFGVGFGLAWQNTPPAKESQRRANDTKDTSTKKGGDAAPSVPAGKSVGSIKDQTGTKQQGGNPAQQPQEEVVKWSDKWITYFTGVLCFLTVVQIWSAYRSQRAYLTADPHGVTYFVKGKVSIGHVGFYNAGNMPARQVSYFIDMDASRDRDRMNFEIDESEFRGTNAIAPKNTMKQGAEHKFTPDEIATFENLEDWNHLFVFVWGAVRYTDGFGFRQELCFCHRYDNRGYDESKSVPKGPCIIVEGMRHHEHGNDAT